MGPRSHLRKGLIFTGFFGRLMNMSEHGFDNSSLRELAIHAQRLKANIKTATVYGPDAPVKRGAPIPELFWLNVFLLADVEKSIVKKGADPSHPCFGPDVMAMVAEIQAELMQEV